MVKLLSLLLLLSGTAVAGNAKILLTEDNSIVFNQQVSAEYASKKTLEIMRKAIKTSPLYLVLDTPGGSVTAGLAFVDTIKALGVPVHTITIFAASMGYQFVQELGTRYITNSGTLMSHRGAVGGISGQVPGELNSRIKHIESILSGMSARASARVSMSKKDYDAAIVNELWVSGEEAVANKHADAIADVSCDKNLMQGTYEDSVNTIFGPVSLTFSKCPLISNPISIEFGKSVKPEDFGKLRQLLESKKHNINLTF